MLQNTSYVVINIKSYSKIWLSLRNLRNPRPTGQNLRNKKITEKRKEPEKICGNP